MQVDDNELDIQSEAIDRAFSVRMMQNALLHRVDQGLDAFHFYGFQALGLLEDVTRPDVPDDFAAVVRDKNHLKRAAAPDGPNIFLHEESRITVIDVDSMLLHPKCEIRTSVLEFLEAGAAALEPWLTPRTAGLLGQRSLDIRSQEIERWRSAGLELTPVIREDMFLHLAGLRQSFVSHYDDGVNRHLPNVMQPSFDSLAHLRPPLWGPTEQLPEIRKWITEFAARDTLAEGLTEYITQCGYVPLTRELSAAEVARQWFDQHPDESPNWNTIWNWAVGVGTPIARYHAITIALHIPEARPSDSMEQLWNAVADVLDVTTGDDAEASAKDVWKLYCELAAHFSRHIETLHPGQHGERIACYGWWLAAKVGHLFGVTDQSAKNALDRLVRPEADLSFSRWLVGRSPVVPSPFRYCSLYMSSVWAMSLLTQLSDARSSLALDQSPPDVREIIGTFLRGYLLASPLANCVSVQPVFGFQENEDIGGLCGEVIPPEECDAFVQLASFRRDMRKTTDVQPRLERLGEDPPTEQRLTMLFLKDAVFSGAEFDEALSTWLDQTPGLAQDLQQLEPQVLDPLLELLSEFHQRRQADWAIRLPHILSCAIEQSDDEARVKRLFLSILFMSVNAGIGSPIQRVLSSKWRPHLVGVLQTWRENSAILAQLSEPWVAGRIRATSAVVSRLIGPRPPDSQATASEHDS